MEAGQITFSTALDNEQLEKELKQVEREIKSLEEKIARSNSTKSGIEEQMERADREIMQAKAHIEQLKAEAASFPATSNSAADFAETQAALNSIAAQIKADTELIDRQTAHIDGLNDQWQKADSKAKAYESQLASAKGRAAELGTELSASAKKGGKAMQQSLAQAEGRFAAFGKRVNGYLKNLFVFGLVLEGLRQVKEYLGEALGENDRFAASLANLKATMAGLAAPLVNGIATALTALMNMASRMLTALASLIDSVFKTDLAGSIKSAKAAAQAAEREAKAKKKTAKAAKEAAKSIMAFDEINAMQADKNSDSDEDGGGGALDWDALGAGKIDSALTAIMGILGAALLAVGAILCFSGINIPLGITLMAIGALMVYTAIQENWGGLPAEVQQVITALMLIAGAALLVLGCVLAFASPATMPLGIGMMAAGAALLWAAVALNWGAMDSEMQTVVSTLMGILGAALLVIGAVLAFSGGGTALGIGLMIAGAASMAAAVALNWDKMPEDVQNAVSAIMAIVGVAFLVIGAILCLTGAALPLGVGLLIVGAGLLVADAALNWGKMSDEMRSFVQEGLAIVGGALIVIGLILICTGAGIPLGIACILAGIGAFVAAVALDPDYFLNAVRDVWAGVTSFWDQYIAPVFTLQFWQDLWKNMVNGLIGCINSGLSAFGGFVNNITSGISGLLSGFGVDWSWSVQMPQLPYLAQGAVIPPNRKFAAVLGDQTSGYNLEAPESLIRQIVREESGTPDQIAAAVQRGVAAALLQSGGPGGQEGDVTLILQVGNEQLAVATAKGATSAMRRGLLKPELAFGM
ncbi:hypothetical protein [Adlercreutzia caecimuris]|uniref:hypothetical protein n=1 Tax=Adlercreutzia caecimuris TaxID=671266 RepID=UPI00272D76A3|nr:hypothetical protein [Adlercreutzia caecimuris]